MSRPTSREIDAEAADWAARVDRGALNAEEQARLDAWLASDTRRRGAFMRMRAISLHTERARALGPNYNPDTYAEPETSLGLDVVPLARKRLPIRRRRFLWLGSAVAAVAVGTIGVGSLDRRQPLETKLGEVRVVSLDDGSVLTLNTDSRLRVRLTDERRSIALLEGEVLFDVAEDETRPFVVDAGETEVTAIGTSFAVRRLEGAPIEVLVREGVVEFKQAGAVRPLTLVSSTKAVAPSFGSAEGVVARTLTPDSVARQLSWREGRLAFEGETLAEAARAFARYSETKILVDPAIADQQITGVFNANDPVTFAEAAAATLDLRAQVAGSEVRIRRR